MQCFMAGGSSAKRVGVKLRGSYYLCNVTDVQGKPSTNVVNGCMEICIHASMDMHMGRLFMFGPVLTHVGPFMVYNEVPNNN